MYLNNHDYKNQGSLSLKIITIFRYLTIIAQHYCQVLNLGAGDEQLLPLMVAGTFVDFFSQNATFVI